MNIVSQLHQWENSTPGALFSSYFFIPLTFHYVPY